MNIKQQIKDIEDILQGDWSPTTSLRDELTRPRTPSFQMPEDTKEEDVKKITEHFIQNWTVGLVRILDTNTTWPKYNKDAKEYIYIFTPNSTIGESTMLQWMDDLIRNKKTDNTKITFETIRSDMNDPTGPRFFMRIGSIIFQEGHTTLEGSVSTEFSSCIPINIEAANFLLKETSDFVKNTKHIQKQTVN